jgi:hypothetical protein
MISVFERRNHYLGILVLLSLLAALAPLLTPTASAQDTPPTIPDLASIVLSPLDEGLEDHVHVGAFDESLASEAAMISAYHGNPDGSDALEATLRDAGFLRMHVSTMRLPNERDAGATDQIVRSYVMYFFSSEGAATAFAALEDETGATGASDVEPSRLFGEQTDLTADGGYDAESRPFRSLDLTVRVGNRIGGVTLIAYPTASGFEPDQAEVEQLGTLLETRLIEPPAPSIGVSVARLDPDVVVTYDDAYYRRAGVDIPLDGESPAAMDLRTAAYGDARAVYQLFQGIDGIGSLGGLYSLTLYEFIDAEAAQAWLDESADLIQANDYYANLEPAVTGAIAADATAAYIFGPFDAPARARIVLARIGEVVIRVQIVPNGALPLVPAELAAIFVQAQTDCLASGACISIPVPEALASYLTPPPPASPIASPVD